MFKLMFVFAMLLLLALPVAVWAQDVTPEPGPVTDELTPGDTPLVDDEISPAPADSLPSVEEPDVSLALWIGAPLTVLIVSLLKRIRALDTVPASTLTGIVAAVLWGVSLVARSAGYATEFNSVAAFLETSLPALAELLIVLIGSTGAYYVAKKTGTPVVSYQRPNTG